MYTCEICNKPFKSKDALNGHKRMHGESSGKIHVIYCSCTINRKVIKASNLDKYLLGFKPCAECGKIEKRNLKFCSGTCRAKFTNRERKESGWSRTEESRAKTARTIRQNNRHKQTPFEWGLDDAGDYDVIRIRTCRYCKSKFVTRTVSSACNACLSDSEITKRREKKKLRGKYGFTFDIYNYPDLFDLDLISRLGMYSPRNRDNRNIDGLSRDHRVSVAEAIDNGYDPYYITHPINCELMPFRKNSSKNDKSSIVYDELVRQVDQYDKTTLLHRLDSNQHDR